MSICCSTSTYMWSLNKKNHIHVKWPSQQDLFEFGGMGPKGNAAENLKIYCTINNNMRQLLQWAWCDQEKTLLVENRTVQGLFQYSMPRYFLGKNCSSEVRIIDELCNFFLSLNQNSVGVKSMLGEIMLGEKLLYVNFFQYRL